MSGLPNLVDILQDLQRRKNQFAREHRNQVEQAAAAHALEDPVLEDGGQPLSEEEIGLLQEIAAGTKTRDDVRNNERIYRLVGICASFADSKVRQHETGIIEVCEYVASSLRKRMRVPVEDDELWHETGDVNIRALYSTADCKAELARLDHEGYTATLLAEIWERFESVANEINLPHPKIFCGQPRDKPRGKPPLSWHQRKKDLELVEKWERFKEGPDGRATYAGYLVNRALTVSVKTIRSQIGKHYRWEQRVHEKYVNKPTDMTDRQLAHSIANGMSEKDLQRILQRFRNRDSLQSRPRS